MHKKTINILTLTAIFSPHLNIVKNLCSSAEVIDYAHAQGELEIVPFVPHGKKY